MLGLLFWLSVLFVIYVYFGYPILITVMALFYKHPVYDSNYTPTVTLLITAHNEEKIISEKLKNSLALEYPQDRLRILVADDGSVDRSADIVRSFADQGVDLISYSERKGKLTAINKSMKAIKSDIVLLSDADNYYNHDTLREIVKPFIDPSIGAVSGGRGVVGKDALGNAEGTYWKYEEFIKRQESKIGSCVGVAGDALAIRRELYPYPPNNIINDDFFIALSIIKQGFRVVYAPMARSFHPVSNTVQGEVERRSRMVAGRYQSLLFSKKFLPYNQPKVLWQVLSHKYFRPIIPFSMLVALLTNILTIFVQENVNFPIWLKLSWPYNWILFTLQMLFYFTAFVGMQYRFNGLFGKMLYIPTFFVNSNFAAVRGLYRYLTDHQSVKWNRVSHSGRTIK